MAAGASVRLGGAAEGAAVLALAGRLDARAAGALWREAHALARQAGSAALALDVGALEYCDGAGAALLAALEEAQARTGGRCELRGLRPEWQPLLELARASAVVPTPPSGRSGAAAWVAAAGQASLAVAADLHQLVAFVGELGVFLVGALRHPRQLRLRDAVAAADRAGLGATPIILLVGFLLGLILAFQGAIPLLRFGAQVFVADFIGIAMLRELGPLMASILLTARSASAFAAELGTMKVNEEIDALTTMGIEPVRFLVVPRVVAAVAVVPALAMLTSLAGLAGGAVVFCSMGFPLVMYLTRIGDSVKVGDVVGGVAKALAFGLIVAAVGCQRGLATGQGAGAVGASTTSSVVSGIILIAVADGIFAVAFYVLGF